jgi:hypothetical protein
LVVLFGEVEGAQALGSRDCPEAEMAALRAMLEEHPAAANRS